ncbi:hypothetical protein [Nocardiopsis sp. NPDC006938]|uniref:hypothetical protein n=1 Tax=Nocardiopsis sp. NPDC006938 TaxID=3364337 RepID=UPI00367D4C96
MVWAAAALCAVTAVFALVAYGDTNTSGYGSRGLEALVRQAALRDGLAWAVVFGAAYTSVGVRLAGVRAPGVRKGEPRALYWTAVAVACAHLFAAAVVFQNTWGNWMDVVLLLAPLAVLGALSTVAARSALLDR